jgi:hypothetical protein
LDADHPENGVLIPCRFTAFALKPVQERSLLAMEAMEPIWTRVAGERRNWLTLDVHAYD